MYVKGDDIKTVDCNSVFDALVTDFLPFLFDMCKEDDIKRLTFMSCFQGKAKNDNFQIFVIKALIDGTLESWGFMCVMTIHKQHDWL